MRRRWFLNVSALASASIPPTRQIQRRAASQGSATDAPLPSSPATTTTNSGTSAQPPRPPAPLILLDQVFRSDASARSLHKELLRAIASGNSEESSEIAAALASIVKRRSAPSDTPPTPSATPVSIPLQQPELPPVTESSIGFALDKVADVVASQNATNQASKQPPTSSIELSAAPWNSSKHLTVTILETSFEVSEEDEGAMEEHERILDQYLRDESERWKAQKHAIAHAVLEAARRCGVTPLTLQDSDESSSSSPLPTLATPPSTGTMNVLKHCNVVVRGEVPEVTSSTSGDVMDACREELAALEKRYTERGAAPMSTHEKQIALMELVMSRTTVRYSVGLKKDLSSSLDRSVTVGKDASSLATAERFHQNVIEALNSLGIEDRAGEERAARQLLSQPVLPYSFMIKLCLWYDAEAIVNSGDVGLP
ncbi:GPI-anchored surface protein, putative [Bodo saltans]|uniref:GPI-anchored surface protein, putative n=1 Tax=Bodo saltans TaxID=75058 RepID=A0A0S4JIK9_BODSA|nr:GPI-anchored surface protein, putative [Bodo saltans]|eukprot:CUG89072.1 GPI-anchored surface protein, putative [Bodo saltans]